MLTENDAITQMAIKYRAFGYVAIEKYELAVIDIKLLHTIDRTSECMYNKYLAKGILRMDSEDYLMACK